MLSSRKKVQKTLKQKKKKTKKKKQVGGWSETFKN